MDSEEKVTSQAPNAGAPGAPGKGIFAKLGMPAIIGIAVAAVLVLIFIFSGGLGKTMHKTFDSPKSYFSYVTKQTVLGKKDNAARSVFDNFSDQITDDNKAVEEQIRKLFPYASVLRMDADTTKQKGDYESILSTFANREADILVGTQMIVKGHDFPYVTLVGILAADMSLNANDYRAGERTYQLLVQAAGALDGQ